MLNCVCKVDISYSVKPLPDDMNWEPTKTRETGSLRLLLLQVV